MALRVVRLLSSVRACAGLQVTAVLRCACRAERCLVKMACSTRALLSGEESASRLPHAGNISEAYCRTATRGRCSQTAQGKVPCRTFRSPHRTSMACLSQALQMSQVAAAAACWRERALALLLVNRCHPRQHLQLPDSQGWQCHEPETPVEAFEPTTPYALCDAPHSYSIAATALGPLHPRPLSVLSGTSAQPWPPSRRRHRQGWHCTG